MKDKIEKIIREEFKNLFVGAFIDSPPVEHAIESITESIGAILAQSPKTIPPDAMDAEEFEKLLNDMTEASMINIDEASNANWLKISYHLYEAHTAIKSRRSN